MEHYKEYQCTVSTILTGDKNKILKASHEKKRKEKKNTLRVCVKAMMNIPNNFPWETTENDSGHPNNFAGCGCGSTAKN